MMSVIPFRRKTPPLVIGSEEQVEPGNISGNAKSKKRRERREILLNHNHNHNLYLPQKRKRLKIFLVLLLLPILNRNPPWLLLSLPNLNDAILTHGLIQNRVRRPARAHFHLRETHVATATTAATTKKTTRKCA